MGASFGPMLPNGAVIRPHSGVRCAILSININEDRQAALAESKTFLDKGYTGNFSPSFVEGWTAVGSPK